MTMDDPSTYQERTLDGQAGQGPRLTARPLSRRTVLRGAGVALSLPALEAMAVARPAAAGPRPRRLVHVYVPNGVRLDHWRQAVPMEGRHPKAGARPLGELPPLLQPLEPFKASLQLLRGLAQDKARANGDGPGDHARASAVYLTGVQPLKTEGRVRVGISADQIAAQQVGGATRVRSLALGTETGRQSGQCDSGYACAYSGHVSWESATTPAAKDTDPRRVFDRLFRGGDPARSASSRREAQARRRSLLDFVRAESKALSKRVGKADRARLEEYETGLRELERQLDFPGAAHVDSVPDDARPPAGLGNFETHARLLGDVLTLALEADVTRIATLMYGNEGSGRRYVEVGVKDGHHGISHHGGDPKKIDAIGRINRLHMASFARLVGQLAERPDGEGRTLLDSTMLVYGSGIAEGDRHDHHDLPMVLLGGRDTELQGGRTTAFSRGTPAGDLHLALLARMGVTDAKLGDARGPLEGV